MEKRKMIKVVPCDTFVNIRLGNIPGYIIGIRILGDSVGYLVSYFWNNAFSERWFSPCELEFQDDIKKQSIGFINEV